MENETATLTCEPSRVNANVRWFKDGKEITTTDGRFKPVKDGKKLKLIITDAQLSDGGVYTCMIDDKTTKAILKVEGKYKIKKTTFILNNGIDIFLISKYT